MICEVFALGFELVRVLAVVARAEHEIRRLGSRARIIDISEFVSADASAVLYRKSVFIGVDAVIKRADHRILELEARRGNNAVRKVILRQNIVADKRVFFEIAVAVVVCDVHAVPQAVYIDGIPHVRFHSRRHAARRDARACRALNKHAWNIERVHNDLKCAGVTAAHRLTFHERAVRGIDVTVVLRSALRVFKRAVIVIGVLRYVLIRLSHLIGDARTAVRGVSDGVRNRFVELTYRRGHLRRRPERIIRIVVVGKPRAGGCEIRAVLCSRADVKLVHVHIEQLGMIHIERVARRAECHGQLGRSSVYVIGQLRAREHARKIVLEFAVVEAAVLRHLVKNVVKLLRKLAVCKLVAEISTTDIDLLFFRDRHAPRQAYSRHCNRRGEQRRNNHNDRPQRTHALCIYHIASANFDIKIICKTFRFVNRFAHISYTRRERGTPRPKRSFYFLNGRNADARGKRRRPPQTFLRGRPSKTIPK